MATVLKTIIMDDQEWCRKELSKRLELFEDVQVLAEIDDENKLFDYLNKNKVDLIFLDIDLGKSSGFEIAGTIKKNHENTMFIFVTGFCDFAIEGYDYEPVDFLIKPIRHSRLERAIVRAKKNKVSNIIHKEKKITVNNGNEIEVVRVSEIVFLEKVDKKVHIYCINGRKIESTDTIKAWEKFLTGYGFLKSHQSFIIPLDKIKSIKLDKKFNTYSYYIELESADKYIPLSRKYYKIFKSLLL